MDDPNIHTDGEHILVYEAPDQTTAELVRASLQAAGIQAVVQNQYAGPAAGLMPHLGTTYGRGVLVPVAQAAAAQALLEAEEPTEAELAAAAEADTMTLEEAEAQVK